MKTHVQIKASVHLHSSTFLNKNWPLIPSLLVRHTKPIRDETIRTSTSTGFGSSSSLTKFAQNWKGSTHIWKGRNNLQCDRERLQLRVTQAARGTSVLPNLESYAQRENKLLRQEWEKLTTHVASEVHLFMPRLQQVHRVLWGQGYPEGTRTPTCSSRIAVSYCFLGMLHSPSGTSQTGHGKDVGQHLVKKSSPMRRMTCPSLLIQEWFAEECQTAQDTLSGYISKLLSIQSKISFKKKKKGKTKIEEGKKRAKWMFLKVTK